MKSPMIRIGYEIKRLKTPLETMKKPWNRH
jgi:hypothetical protein